MNNFDELITNVIGWADDKGILVKDNAPKQMLKVLEEETRTTSRLIISGTATGNVTCFLSE